MPFISITRLRIRSIGFMPMFALHALRANAQVKKATGFLGGSLLPDQHRVFWTMTMWDSQESMREYMTTGPHRAAMPHLLNWCDEASVVHWEQETDELPTWEEADQRMRADGRASKVRYPSLQHAALDYPPPRITATSLVRPSAAR